MLQIGADCSAALDSVRVEKLAKVIRGDIPARLPENGMAGSRVKLAMVGNG